MKSFISLLSLLLLSACCQAQTGAETVDMADTLRSNGKIYVVVGVLSIIFLGILIFLIILDRKVSKLEKLAKNTPES